MVDGLSRSAGTHDRVLMPHLVLSGKAERFATFDEALVKQARKLGVQPTVSVP
jgi:hypothetical protein